MRFFVPSANDLRHSEDVYRSIRDRVAAVSGGVSERRIYHFKFLHEGRQRTAVVGSDNHGFGNGPVLAIFEGLDGFFYICTQDGGILNVKPHPVQTSAMINAEDFSALA
jgi:hypothetical protein